MYMQLRFRRIWNPLGIFPIDCRQTFQVHATLDLMQIQWHMIRSYYIEAPQIING